MEKAKGQERAEREETRPRIRRHFTGLSRGTTPEALTNKDALPPNRTAPQFAKDVKRGKGGNGIFLDPWWLFGPGHEVTANKRLWDLGAELVDNIPHSKEVRSTARRLI